MGQKKASKPKKKEPNNKPVQKPNFQAPKPSFTAPQTFVLSGKTLKQSEFLRPSLTNKDALVAQLKLPLNSKKRPIALQVEFSLSFSDSGPEQIYLVSVKDASGSPIPLKFSQLPEIKKQLSKIAISHIYK